MITNLLSRLLPFLLVALQCVVSTNHKVYADEQPTQEHQALYSTTYIPLKRSQIVGGQPIIQATLNKAQSASFIIDTGASSSILSPELAKRLNLKLQPGTQDDGAPYLWNGKQASEAVVSVIKIGNFTINVDHGFFYILPDRNSTLFPKPNFGDVPFDGVIGVNVLEHFAVLLDTSQHTFSLCVPGNLALQQVGQAGYTAPYIIPIAQKDSRWFATVQLTNNGISQSEEMLLDTGTNQTVMSDITANYLGLKISEEHQTTNAYSDNVPIDVSTVSVLDIGGIVLSRHAVGVAPVSKQQPPRLGMDILSGYRVLIDFPAKKMYLQPNPSAVPAITIGPAPATTTPPAK